MIVEKFSITSGTLNAGTLQELAVSDVSLDELTNLNNDKRNYRPTSIRIENITGDAIYVCFLNEIEKSAYDIDSNVTDLFKIANNSSEIYTFDRWKITDILVQGTVGVGHSVGLDIYVIKE